MSLRPIHAIRAEAGFREDERREDESRAAFLRALDASEFAVDDWEAQFIESFLSFTSNRPSDAARWWTEGRRRSADRMARKYAELAREAGIKDASAARVTGVKALDLPHVAGRCDYLVRGEDRRQRRCGEPAVVKLRAGLELCQEHERQRQEGIQRLRDLQARQLRS